MDTGRARSADVCGIAESGQTGDSPRGDFPGEWSFAADAALLLHMHSVDDGEPAQSLPQILVC